jgi:hypothetical protein
MNYKILAAVLLLAISVTPSFAAEQKSSKQNILTKQCLRCGGVGLITCNVNTCNDQYQNCRAGSNCFWNGSNPTCPSLPFCP